MPETGTHTTARDFRKALRAGRPLIACCLGAAAVLALCLNAWTTPVYRASTRIETRRPSDPPEMGASSFQAENVGLYTTAMLITNRALLEQIDRDFAGRDWLDPPPRGGRKTPRPKL